MEAKLNKLKANGVAKLFFLYFSVICNHFSIQDIGIKLFMPLHFYKGIFRFREFIYG